MFNQSYLEKKREGPSKYNEKWKRRSNNWDHRNTKRCKKILWTIYAKKLDNLGKMEKVMETKSSKIESIRSRKPEHTDNN